MNMIWSGKSSILVVVLIVMHVCITAQTSLAASPTARTITYSRVIDLSHVIDTNIPVWPGDPPVEFETVADMQKDGYYLRKFTIGEHSATHMNAPNCFHEGGVDIVAYSPESLVVPAVVIDARKQAAGNPDYALSKEDILTWETQYGQIPAGSVVIMYTGWQKSLIGCSPKPGFRRELEKCYVTQKNSFTTSTSLPILLVDCLILRRMCVNLFMEVF